MSHTLTASKLRENTYRVLDQVLEAGVPVEIERSGQRLRISPVDETRPRKLAQLTPQADHLQRPPEELVHLDWSSEWKL